MIIDTSCLPDTLKGHCYIYAHTHSDTQRQTHARINTEIIDTSRLPDTIKGHCYTHRHTQTHTDTHTTNTVLYI